MHNLEDKRVKVLVILVASVGFLIYYFYPKDEYVMEMVKPTRPPIQKVEEIKELPKQEKEEVVKIEEKKVEKEKEIEKKGKVLFSSTDSSGRYTIQLINNIDIEIREKNSTRYLPIIGEIAENSNISRFTISISEDYLNHLSELSIKILDETNKDRVIETVSYFLGSLDVNSSYNIKLNISGDTLDGEITSSEKMSDSMINELSNDEPVMINTEENNRNIIINEQVELNNHN
jgi:hypothetical protein